MTRLLICTATLLALIAATPTSAGYFDGPGNDSTSHRTYPPGAVPGVTPGYPPNWPCGSWSGATPCKAPTARKGRRR
jgi:hypothetical protein